MREPMKHTLSILFSIVLFGSMTVMAQGVATTDSAIVKKDITIEKEYTPHIGETTKSTPKPTVVEPSVTNEPASYSDFSYSLTPEFQMRKLGSANLKLPQHPTDRDGYLRLGLGNCWSTLGDLMLPLLRKPKYSLDFNLNHKGMYNSKKHHKTIAGLGYNRFYQNGDFYINGNYSYRGFNYYGDNALSSSTTYTTLSNTPVSGADFFHDDASIHAWDAEVGYRSYTSDELVNRLSAELRYDGFMPNEGLTEHRVKTALLYENTLDNGNHWGIDFNMENFFYNSNHADSFSINEDDGFTVVKLNPYFQWERDRVFLRIGGSLNVASQGRAVAPTPDIRGTLTLVKNTWYLYAGLEGHYESNSLKDLIEENHFINLNQKVKNTYTPVDLYGGIKLKVLYNLLTDLSLRYKYMLDAHFYVNDTTLHDAGTTVMSNVFNSQISDASVFIFAFNTQYEMSRLLDLTFSMKYNSWNVKKGTAWGMPKWEWNFGGKLHAGKRMSAYTNMDIKTGRKALQASGSTRNLKPVLDLNLGADYAWNSRLSLFLKLNNLLHRHYEQWYGYEVNGFNALAGFSYTF